MKKQLLCLVTIFCLALVGVWTAEARPLGELFTKVNPSVGVIRTVQKKLPGTATPGAENVFGIGSGVLISADGKVLTAAHVVHSADAVTVEFGNGEEIPARILGSFPSADIALLQLQHVPAGIDPPPLGDSDTVKPGDEIMVIGAPYGLSHTLTAGYISGRHRKQDLINELIDIELLQSDAAVNRGNSGGPMFNMNGEVIGIVSHILTKSGGFEGISFAVASNVARKMLLEQPTRWAGVEGTLLRGPLARAFNLPQPSGYLVQRVADGSSGEQLGLQMGTLQMFYQDQPLVVGGDVILEMDGVTVTGDPRSMIEIIKRIQTKRPGETLTATVLRGGVIMTLQTKLDE